MKVNSIQANEVVAAILRSPERNDSGVDAGKGSAPELSVSVIPSLSTSTNAPQSPDIQAQALITHINYTKEQLDKILVDFPPFFPPGSSQRIDLIKTIRGIQDQVEKSSVRSDMKQEISLGKLSMNASDSDISVALEQLLSLKDELSKSLPIGDEGHQPGVLVSIKV
jgi:hypothetical protein